MNPAGVRVEPFSALVFNRAKAGRLAELVAPPYDLIDRTCQDELYARSQHNVVRLELNRDPDPYRSAAATLQRWLANGILERTAPAVFLYSQSFDLGGRKFTRQGWVARIGLEEFSSGRILPHERTFPKAKEDRLRLMEATRANISSVFGLYPSGNAELTALMAAVGSRPPMLDTVDDLGITNQVRAVGARREVAIIQRAFESARLLIADGHHRYETALEYRRRLHVDNPSASVAHGQPAVRRSEDYVMMTLVAFDDPGLVILPTHRVIRRLSAEQAGAFASRIREKFSSEEFERPEALLAELQKRGRGYIGTAVKGSCPSIVKLQNWDHMTQALPEVRDEVRQLDVAVLHALIFENILGITPEMVRSGDNVAYTIDGSAALAEVAAGTADGAFILNPPTVYDVERVSKAGATMPEKSTYFYPKLLTGLLINPLD